VLSKPFKSFAAFTVENAKPKRFFKRCFCAPVELSALHNVIGAGTHGPPEVDRSGKAGDKVKVSAIAELALR
jgi:hypothetical protein